MNRERRTLASSRSEEEKKRLSIPDGLNCLGWVPEDDTIRTFDIEGRSILETPDCPAVQAAKSCMALMSLPVSVQAEKISALDKTDAT